MSTIQSGLAHCVHHDNHFEFCYSLAERRAAIQRTKPADEQAVRLANLWLFPAEMLPVSRQKACADRQKADADWHKAYVDWLKAYADWQRANADMQNTDDIQALHDKLVAQGYICTWNGTSIFPRKGEA